MLVKFVSFLGLLVSTLTHAPQNHHRHRTMRGPLEVASWFYDAGDTACGFHSTYGVANKVLACGTRVLMCSADTFKNHGCVGPRIVVTVEDRGPFVAGRTWDLNPSAKAAMACSDLCNVRSRIL